ncbi:hypothetical protein B0T16DRAFT_116090 [Cercophora newfieldiana]|uniref:Rhodopsin domain-containing protein n=1 Tax=Cercophora newfieldiana TaxID=92897 RepID=A0AA39Y9D9_9PEZI|nr:hypothetical protein B0T16DRAFT_116090 [Cercophora newfieldiana]
MLFVDKTIDYGPRLNAIMWLMVSVAAIFLFTRLYLKKCQMRGLWWDDYTLLASWVCQTIQAGLVSFSITLGYGKPIPAIPTKDGAKLLLVLNILSTLLIIANFLGKLSFGLTLMRIPAVWMRLSVLFIIITLAATLSMSSVLVWIECLGFRRVANCINDNVSLSYNMFSCGRMTGVPRVDVLVLIDNSIFGCHGCGARILAMEVHLESADEQEGKDWCSRRHEHGRIVGHPPKPRLQKLTVVV